MPTQTYTYAWKSRRTNPGYLGLFIDGFVSTMREVGYSERSIEKHIHSIAHLGEWLDGQDIALSQIDERVISRFAKHRCTCPSRRIRKPVSGRDRGRVNRFVDFLRWQEAIPPPFEPEQDNEPPQVQTFGDWLAHRRGLSAASICTLKRRVLILLPMLGDEPEHYDVAGVRHVIHTLAQTRGIAEMKALCQALRSFLRFLATSGVCSPRLVEAVPTVPHWRLSSLPKYLPPADVERLLTVWTGSDSRSLRNQAILLLLARLGLRARDVVTLRLDAIDWQQATLQVLGKSRQPAKLPLPQAVGDALLAYLHSARPALAVPEVFLRLRPPQGALSSSAAISGIVDDTLNRAGIHNPPARGAHVLRHSAATALLRDGATLEEVSVILRHRSTDTTAHYAKVAIGPLRALAQPWPAGASC